ncbi:hypothetical protein [Variovorax atrisoli]|uniref:hypothetical protein n=1 Tax=Variovorax atrisoli TaxID=3394203 RepID=UPI003396E2D8
MKHLRARCLAGLIPLLHLLPCPAATADVPKGVWEGTLGTKAIVACFNAEFPSGSYFYRQYKKPIPLSRIEKDSFWHEAGDTGLWSLEPARGNTLTGTWKSVKGTPVTLPIKLDLADATGGDRACGSEGYAGQLETPPKIEIGKKEEFAAGRSFRRLRFAGQETIELSGPEPTLAAINRELRRDFDTSKDAVTEYFDKRREFLGRVGVPAEDENTADPEYWTSQWLSIRNYTWAAGMGRSGISWFYRTWDLQTGRQIDPWSWFGLRSLSKARPAEGRISGTGGASMTPKLRRFLFRHAGIDPSKAEDNCRSNYEEGAYYDLTLETKGMRFAQPAYGNGCEIEIEVPYTELDPVLTPVGKAAVRRIIESAK